MILARARGGAGIANRVDRATLAARSASAVRRIELVIDGLACGLMAAGHDVLLAAPAGSTRRVPQIPGLPARDPARMGCSVVEIPHVLSAYAALEEADVVHDHTVVGLGPYVCDLARESRWSPPITVPSMPTSIQSMRR